MPISPHFLSIECWTLSDVKSKWGNILDYMNEDVGKKSFIEFYRRYGIIWNKDYFSRVIKTSTSYFCNSNWKFWSQWPCRVRGKPRSLSVYGSSCCDVCLWNRQTKLNKRSRWWQRRLGFPITGFLTMEHFGK